MMNAVKKNPNTKKNNAKIVFFLLLGEYKVGVEKELKENSM